jgi:hypothetical protein
MSSAGTVRYTGIPGIRTLYHNNSKIQAVFACYYYITMPTSDPIKKKASARRHYLKHAAAIKAAVKINRDKAKDRWREYKASLACVQCGENHPATFDFHHVIRKPDNQKVNKLLSNKSYKKAIKEIKERCVVLCANCHRKLHHDEWLATKKGAEAP